ncbi:MAG TPA: hypothetical protein VGC60_11755 [Pyrinomonadaceae bacterium]|jgi:hypothetical protein
MNPPQPTWNSLEIVKLLVSGLTPIVVLIIGIWISRSLKRLEFLQWTNQKITEKRIAVFEELAPLLNDLLCYFTVLMSCFSGELGVGLMADHEPSGRIPANIR